MLNILDNQSLHVIAEVAAIVIGSMLLGLLLGYLYWGEFKKKSIKLGKNLDLERDKAIQLKEKLIDLEVINDQLQSEIAGEKLKYGYQTKSLFDQQQKQYEYEKQIKQLKETIGELTSKADQYESRLHIIKEELNKPKEPEQIIGRVSTPAPSPSRANYEHVSQLLGKPVIENDLTIIAGIGPRIASLLESRGIETWEQLSITPVESLQSLLIEAGGVYKSLDPAHWPRQASMAARSEWRKLRVYQQSLKETE
ncbi:MAG: hypothetical protein ABIQ11_11380 [Saprospiraceae bacterium]